MATLHELRAKKEALENAYYTGIRSVSVDGQSISFDGPDGLSGRLASLERQIQEAEETVKTKPRFSAISMTRGA